MIQENEIRLEAQDLNQQGALLLKAGKAEAAKEKFDKAIELDPMLMDSYKNYGDLYMALNKYQDAKNSYKKAMLIEKKGLLHFLYGNACIMNDEMNEGISSYNLAISEGFDSAEMMFFMGLAYENISDDKMALRYFQKACAKDPSNTNYLIKKIGTLIKLDMYDTAEEAADELLGKNPELFDGYHIKTQLLLRKRDLDAAINFAKYASDKFCEDSDLMYDYAKALSLAGKLKEACTVIENAKQMKYFADAKRDFTILEVKICAELGEFDKAIERCHSCIDLERDNGFDGEAHFILMNLYLAKLDYDKLIEEATSLANRNERDMYYYTALYYKAFGTKQSGKTEEALDLYKEANSIYRIATIQNPAAIDIYLYRIMCLKDMESYDKALELLELVENINANIAQIYTLRADVYRLQGKSALAENELKKAYSINPDLVSSSKSAGE